MIEDPSVQISKVSNIKHLMPIVLHKSTDKHYYISLIYRIANPGVHYILCRKLRNMNLIEEIPQLLDSMLKGYSNTVLSNKIATICLISYPIYDLLLHNAKKDKNFRIALFLRLKSVLGTVDESKASYCYFLCCDILEIDSFENKRNLGIIYKRFKLVKFLRKKFAGNNKKFKIFRYMLRNRTFSIVKRQRSPTLNGLMLYFAKSIISLFNIDLYKQIDEYSKIFNSKKTFRRLQFKNGHTKFKANCLFVENLVDISSNLKKMPVNLRQRTLKIQLEILNREISNKIFNPINPTKKILKFSLEHAKVLDSAENCPYIVIFECADVNNIKNNESLLGLRKAKALMRQLESLNDLGELGDIDGIKESLIIAIEKALFQNVVFDDSFIKDLANMRINSNDTVSSNDNINCNISEYIEKDRFKDQKEINYDVSIAFDDNKTHNEPENSMIDLDIVTCRQGFDELVANNMSPILEDKKMNYFLDIYSYEKNNSPLLSRQDEKSFSSIKQKIKKSSKFANSPGWDISSFIVKSGNVLKHEYLAYQILTQMKEIFIIEGLPIYIKNYKIILVSDTTGLVETVNDAQSIHRLKADSKFKTLESYFKFLFNGDNFNIAKKNFLYSLVGYSLASYILQIKDRHNGNILVDGFGHIIHVDFGFTFGKHPGIISVENAPFKFSSEYLELIDIDEFKNLFLKGFRALRIHSEKLYRMIEILQDGGYFEKVALIEFIERLRLDDNDKEFEIFCQGLIDRSITSMRTMFYDQLQYLSNGYL